MAETLGNDPGTGIIGYGTTLQGAVTGVIGMLTKISIDGQEADEIDVTTMNSPNRYKAFIAGLIDAHGATLDLIYEDANMTVVINRVGKANESWTIHFTDGSTFVVPGFLKKVGTAIPVNDKITQSVMLRFTGPPVWNVGS